MMWILTPLDDYQTCGDCGAVVWVKGEGLKLHRDWHYRFMAVAHLLHDAADELEATDA